MTGLRAAFLRGRRDLFWIEQVIGAVAPSGLLRLATKELVLQGVDLTARLVKFLLQLLDALDRLGMLAFPIAYFPAEIAPQLLQCPLQTLHGGAVCAGNQRLRRLDRKVQERGIHRATL